MRDGKVNQRDRDERHRSGSNGADEKKREELWMRRTFAVLSLACAIVLAVSASHAEDYPTRPLRIVNPYSAGGAADAVARLVAQELSERLGQSAVVENIAGAGGNIGTSQVARAPADGHTLLFTNTGNVSINPWLFKTPGYDAMADFAHLGMIGVTDLVLVAANVTPFRSVQQVVEAARQNPGGMSCAHAGIGSINHLALVLFRKAADISCTEVAYRGANPAVTDVIGGHVQIFFATIPSVAGAIQAGQMRGLGVTSIAQSRQIPAVPTLSESGLPGFEANLWFGLAARATTPKPILLRLERALAEILASPQFRGRLEAIGVEPRHMDAKTFAGFLAGDGAKWRQAVQESGTEPQ
jgi:tripartite-type tricarboxylate transporter receptor subunit TctC